MKIRGVVVMALALVLGGCVVANALFEPYTNLHFSAYGKINPDGTGRSSPLVVRIYELSSTDAFKDADFFELYDDAPAVLGDDLLSSSELVVRPGRDLTKKLRLHGDTTHIGIIGAFRDIENADWKLMLEADPRGYENVHIRIKDRSISRGEG